LSFTVKSTVAHEQRLVIDYAIDYVKANGGVSGKVFKLKTVELAGFGSVELRRIQLLKDFTTRKHYVGEHWLHFIFNGEKMASIGFQIVAA